MKEFFLGVGGVTIIVLIYLLIQRPIQEETCAIRVDKHHSIFIVEKTDADYLEEKKVKSILKKGFNDGRHSGVK